MLPQYELNPPCNCAKKLTCLLRLLKKVHKQSIHAFVDGEESQFSGDELYAMLSMTRAVYYILFLSCCNFHRPRLEVVIGQM